MDQQRFLAALAEQLVINQEEIRQLKNELKYKDNVISCLRRFLQILSSIAGLQVVDTAKQQYQEEYRNQNQNN